MAVADHIATPLADEFFVGCQTEMHCILQIQMSSYRGTSTPPFPGQMVPAFVVGSHPENRKLGPLPRFADMAWAIRPGLGFF